MVNRLFPILFGAATIVIVQSQITLAVSADEVGKIAEEITVLIQTPGSPGSGIILSKQGNIYSVLTARHVIDSINPGEEADLTTYDGQVYAINTNKIKKFPNVDLAIVEFEANKNYRVAKLGNSQETRAGKTVYVAGFPLPTAAITTSIFNFTEGKVTANANRPLADGYAIVYSNTTLPGMSGGPVLNENGELIGIHGRTDAESSQGTDNPEINIKTGYSLAVPINTYLSLTNRIAATSPTTTKLTADDYFLRAGDKYNKKDFQGAIEDYDRAIQVEPNYAIAYNNRGNVRFELGDKPRAIEDYNRAIQLDPNLAMSYYNRGNARAALGDKPGAIEDYNRAIQLDPNYAIAYNNRGLARSDLGDKPGAIEDYNRAIQLDPNLAIAYNNRGLARAALGDKPRAIEDYNQAIQLDPDYTLAYNNRGNVRFELGDKPGAIEDYNRAIQLDPNLAMSYYNRGNARAALGDKPRAIEDYNRAIQLDPDYTLAYNNRGNVRFDLGDKQGAIEDYNRAIQLDPNLAIAYNNRGLARSDLGDKPGAIGDYQKAANLYLEQGNIEAYQKLIDLIKNLQP
jgi:tetratricopeptide (TPR) repeat protein